MSLVVIAYPNISSTDLNRIRETRKQYDPLFEIVDPHFTFVFPFDGLNQNDLENEVSDLVKHIQPIHFCLRSAIINKDAFSNYYHTFLVPDEGFCSMIRLHDKLYSRSLKPYHRMDIDFIPHLGIGSNEHALQAKALTDEWNATEFSIFGAIQSLNIVDYTNHKITSLKKIHLL